VLERALDAGVPAAWVTADEVYGGSPALREWLEERQVSYVLAVQCTELLEAGGPKGLVRTHAEELAAALPTEQWIACSAGHGAKGRRLYDWTRIQLATPGTAGTARWLLVRRSRRDGELAFYACYGPVATPLVGLVRVAGTTGRWRKASRRPRARWAWTTARSAADRAGIATSPWRCWPMRSWPSPAPRPPAPAGKGGHGSLNGGLGLLPLTVPEVRRLLVALGWTTPLKPGLVLAWSRWRRRHQARARRAHYQRREPQLGAEG
jgi:hypothetical protein